MAVTCFTCGDEGHLARACTNEEALDTRPTWCGHATCDPDTRLITIDLARGTVKKCPECHPTPNKPLTQHSRCPRCKATVYKWDARTPCDSHAAIGAIAGSASGN